MDNRTFPPKKDPFQKHPSLSIAQGMPAASHKPNITTQMMVKTTV
jgi:hypothetical protein